MILAKKEKIKIRGAAKPSIDKYANSTINGLTDNELHDITECSINLIGQFIVWFDRLGMHFSVYSCKWIFFFE
jgi:hypothetical protein